MKNSLRTKIALVSLVFVSSIAYAKKNNKQENKAVFFPAGNVTGSTTPNANTAQTFANAGFGTPATAAVGGVAQNATQKVTTVTGPAQVTGNLFVNGRVYGQFFPAGTDVTKVTAIGGAHAYVLANGKPDATNKTTEPVSVPLLLDTAEVRDLTADNLTVNGNLKLGAKRYVGQFSDFDPATNMIILTFADSSVVGKPARINWAFHSTTTWTGASLTKNEPVSVVITNGGIPDMISPLRPARSFVSNTDMKYTNTVYVWTSKNNSGIGFNPNKLGLVASKSFFGLNQPYNAAYNATTNQDLTLTSSVRNVFSDGGQALANIVAGKMAWGLCSNSMGTAFNSSQARIAGATLADGTPAFYSTVSPFSNRNGDSTAAAGSSVSVAKGTLYYEIIGGNVTDVSLGYTWDRSATLVSVLSGFTTAQLNTLLATLIVLLGTHARGPQPTSREAIIELLSKHGDLLKKTGVLSRFMNA